jgi:hypothetical protein
MQRLLRLAAARDCHIINCNCDDLYLLGDTSSYVQLTLRLNRIGPVSGFVLQCGACNLACYTKIEGRHPHENQLQYLPKFLIYHLYHRLLSTRNMLRLASLASGESEEASDQIQSSGSKTSTSEQSTINVQASPVLQQQLSQPQSSKRRTENHTGGLDNQGSGRVKRFRGSPGSPNPLGGFLYDSHDDCSDGTPREVGEPGTRKPTVADHQRHDYQIQLMLLEQQKKKWLMHARQEQDAMLDNGNRAGQDGTPPTQIQPSKTSQEAGTNDTSSKNLSTLEEYQMQFMLLGQQGKKRLQEQRAICDNQNRNGPDSTGPTQNQTNGTHLNRIGSTASNSTIYRQHEVAQANISGESQSPPVPDTIVSPMQQESTGLGQETAPVVERDEAHEHTLSRPAPSPASLVGDTFGSPQHPNFLPPPASSQFGSTSQSPIQRPNQSIQSFGSMQPAVYYRHEHPIVSRLEPLGNGTYRRSVYNPPPDWPRSLSQQQIPSASPFAHTPAGTASEPVDLTDSRPVPISQLHLDGFPQQSQHPPAFVTSAPPYSNVHWLEDSIFVCHFIRALAVGHFLQYSDLISPVDRAMASAYLWCSLDKDESWENIFGAKDNPLTSRHDLEKLLNRWRGGPDIYAKKLPEAPLPSMIAAGTDKQAVPMDADPQAVASPTQGQQLADAIDRQEAAPILLVDLLKATYENASEWSEQLPTWLENLRSMKDSLPQDEEGLQAHQEKLNKKEAEIDTLDAKFEDIVQTMPMELLRELQQVRERTRLTKLRDKNELNKLLEDCTRGMEEKRNRIAKLEWSVRSLKSGIPEAIETLKKLVARLPDL